MTGTGGRVARAGRVAAAVWLFSALTPGAVRAQEQEVRRLGGERVAVYNLAGEVRVVAGSGPDVVVRLQRHGEDAHRLRVETGQVRGRETLRVVYPSDEVVYRGMGRGSTTLRVRSDGTFSDGGRGGERVRIRGSGSGLEAWVDMVVEVPRGREVAVYLGVGEMDAEGVDGILHLDTGAGEVRASGIRGALSVDTGSGSVRAEDVDGALTVDTGSGRIVVERLDGGEVRLDTGSGGVRVREVRAERLEVDTGSGEVELMDVAAPHMEIDTGSGSVEARLTDDVETLLIDTGSGSVRLEVPPHLGARLEVDVGSGGVEIDVPAQLTVRRRDHVSGRLGDGRGEIRIDTGSGSVTVRGTV